MLNHKKNVIWEELPQKLLKKISKYFGTLVVTKENPLQENICKSGS